MSPQSQFRRELRTSYRPQSLADLQTAGLVVRRPSPSAWRRTTRDHYVRRAETETLTPTQRILDNVPLIPPGGAMTGWAAAFVHGVGQLDGLDMWTMRELPVTICCGADLGRRSTPQVTYTRDRLAGDDVCLVEGIRVVRPLRAGFDGARLAETLEDAVGFVDACAQARAVNRGELSRYLAEHPGWKGVRQATRAVEMADPAARSPGESRLRVCYLVEARLPRPEVNPPIFDQKERLLGIADLFDKEAGLVTEFDGSRHRERLRHHDDNAREEAFESAGLIVVRADGLDLKGDRGELIRRVRDGYQRGLRRDRRHDRWTLVEPQWWIDQQDPMQALTADEKADLFDF